MMRLTGDKKVIEKIKIEHDFLPSKSIEIEFTTFAKEKKTYSKPHIIFARNGMGKTTIAGTIYELKEKWEDSIYVFNQDFLPDFKEILDEKGQGIAVLGAEVSLMDYPKELIEDYRCVFEEEFSAIKIDYPELTDSEIVDQLRYENLDIDYETITNKLSIEIAKFLNSGGSNKNPDKKMVRQLFYYSSFKLDLGTFDKSKRKLVFQASPAVFFEKVSNNVVYKELKENKRRPSDTEKELFNQLDAFVTRADVIDNWHRLKNIDNLKKETLEYIQKNVSPYLEKLNEFLSKIFYGEKRLLVDSLYGVIKSREKGVLFEKLSTAEKNILSICYFFLKVKQQIEANKQKPVLIVLDDLISSTDYDNKVGLYSFFRAEIEELLKLNSDIKFLILTHDEEVYYHFYKVFDDMPVFGKDTIRTSELTISEGLIKRDKEFNFYRNQINHIYQYAWGKAEELDDFIGNIMRRVLEAYSTFNYCTGPSELSTNDEILAKIESKDERDFFKGYMYRLVLNSDSHASDRVQKASLTFHQMFSTEEKQRTAKLLLGFLYRLDSVHLKRMIDVGKNQQSLDNFEKREKKLIQEKEEAEKKLASDELSKNEEKKSKKSISKIEKLQEEYNWNKEFVDIEKTIESWLQEIVS